MTFMRRTKATEPQQRLRLTLMAGDPTGIHLEGAMLERSLGCEIPRNGRPKSRLNAMFCPLKFLPMQLADLRTSCYLLNFETL